MKKRLISAAVATVISAWAFPALAREVVVLDGVVGPQGILYGVDTVGPGTLSVGNQDINTNNDLGGAITSDAAATAIVSFSDNSTVTGFTGTVGSEFLRIDAGAPATTVTFDGDVFSQTFNLTGTGTVNFNGDVRSAALFAGDGFINLGVGRTLTGAITTATANTGTLTLNGGSAVVGAIGGASGIRQINVVGGNAAITGAVQTLGLNLGTNTLTVVGALTTNPGATVFTTIASDSVFGNVTADTSLVNAAGITVIPTVTGVVTSGTNFTIIDAPAGTIGAPVFVTNNNPRFIFAGVPTVTGDVNILLANQVPLVDLVSTPDAIAVAPILDVNAPSGSDLAGVQDAIAVLTDQIAIDHALVQLTPGTTSRAAPWVAVQTRQMFEGMWISRMDEIQGYCCDRACESKEPDKLVYAQKCDGQDERNGWWGKTFGSVGDQDDVGFATGYKTEALGLMLAYDVPLNDQTTIGFGGGYANTSIDGDNSSGYTDIDSYLVTGYVSHVVGPSFIQGALTAGIDEYDGSRSIVFPGTYRKASADYTGQQYTARVSVGRHFYLDQATSITPLASLQVSRIDIDEYTEDGAGDINLRVNSQSYDFVQSGLGIKAARIIQTNSGTFSPEVHARWLHDFSSTTMQQKAAFTGGSSEFTVDGIDQDRETYNVGAGVTFLSCNCDNQSWSVKGLYDYTWSESNYSSNQLSLIASLRF